ncbi:MAG: hypothetical protein NTZ35_00190 [Ignavibacteriales bacterium]|nr:hypothetical protein [Ignavibacteriales bacterium]
MPKDTQVWTIDPHQTLAHIAYPPRLREQALSRVANSPYQIPISPYGRVDTLYVYPTTSTLRDSPLPSMGLYGAAQPLSGGNYKYHIAGAGPNALNAARHEIRHGVANPALEYVDGSKDYGQYLRSDDEMLSRLGSMSDLHVKQFGKLITSPKDAQRAVMFNYEKANPDDIAAITYADDFENSKERRDKMTSMLQRLLTVPAVGAAASSQMDNSNQGR